MQVGLGLEKKTKKRSECEAINVLNSSMQHVLSLKFKYVFKKTKQAVIHHC